MAGEITSNVFEKYTFISTGVDTESTPLKAPDCFSVDGVKGTNLEGLYTLLNSGNVYRKEIDLSGDSGVIFRRETHDSGVSLYVLGEGNRGYSDPIDVTSFRETLPLTYKLEDGKVSFVGLTVHTGNQVVQATRYVMKEEDYRKFLENTNMGLSE